MKRSSIFADTISWLNETIRSEEFADIARMRLEDFTRNRSMTLRDYILIILRHSVKGLDLRISDFAIDTEAKNTCSKQAFSKGRLRIRPYAFQFLFQTLAQRLYTEATALIKGYHLFAVDGTDLNLSNHPKLLEIYGAQTNQRKRGQVQSHCSCLYDVLNSIVLDVQAGTWKANERDQALEHLKVLSEKGLTKTIVLYDRGYPAIRLIKAHQETYKIPYIMRCSKKGFFSEIRDTTKKDSWIVRKTKGGVQLKIRVINFTENGVQRTFITNLPESEFTAEEIRDLYRERWKIETFFNRLKNNLEIENFSGTSEVAVLQDIYSIFLLANMEAALALDAQKKQKKKQQLNRVNTFGSIIIRFYQLFYSSKKRLQEIVEHMLREAIKRVITSTHKGQSDPRKVEHGAIECPMNYRRIS